jgi:hypothetical protein
VATEKFSSLDTKPTDSNFASIEEENVASAMNKSGGEKNKLGLCADCRHAQRIESSKGSLFLLCTRSKIDPRFPKYPRLPVLNCSGYDPPSRSGGGQAE